MHLALPVPGTARLESAFVASCPGLPTFPPVTRIPGSPSPFSSSPVAPVTCRMHLSPSCNPLSSLGSSECPRSAKIFGPRELVFKACSNPFDSLANLCLLPTSPVTQFRSAVRLGLPVARAAKGSCSLGLRLQTLLPSTEVLGAEQLQLRALPNRISL